MNAKIAKKIRKLAKSTAISLTNQGKEISERSYVEVKANRKKQTIYKKDEAGQVVFKTNDSGIVEPEIERVVELSTGTILNSKDSIRGIYRNIKRAVRKGQYNPYLKS